MRYRLTVCTVILLVVGVLASKNHGENPRYHENFSVKELVETFAVNHPHDVPKYVSTKVNGLQKLNDSHLPLSLRAYGKDFNLKVSANKRVQAGTHTVEIYGKDGMSTRFTGTPGEFSTGTLEDDPASSVNLFHTAKGICGSILTSDDFYIISPLPHRVKSDEADHIIYSFSDLDDDNFLKKHLHKRNELLGEPRVLHRSRRSVDESTLHNLAFANVATPAPSVTGRNDTEEALPKKTLELMLAADYTMVEHYTIELLPSYMKAVANVLAGFFRDPTAEYPLDVVLMSSKIFENDQFKAESMGDLLVKFSTWVKDVYLGSGQHHVDASLLLTRNGCKDSCTMEGLALSGQICKLSAQGVSKDRGLMSTSVAAHELGHILGLDHDGEGNDCLNGHNIMSAGSTPYGAASIRWSTCASKALAEIYKNSKSTCLDNEPPKNPLTDSTFQLYGTIYNANKQCAFIYGDEYQMCSPSQHECASLFCQKKGENRCGSIYYPAAHGTECAPFKWCIDGACVPNGLTPDPPVHGVWSAWGDYGACSKSCGIGVQWRTRQCNNPEPAHGGQWCDPSAVRKVPEHAFHKTCNTQPCVHAHGVNSDRDAQCRARKPGTMVCTICSSAGPCELICGQSRGGGYLVGLAESGTSCIATGIPDGRGICVAGVCTEIGCDKRINSGQELDRCGVCNGNGDSCHRFNGSDSNEYDSFGVHSVMTVPSNTTHAEVRELHATMSFLGVKAGDNNDFLWKMPSVPRNSKVDGNMRLSYEMKAFIYPDKLTFHRVEAGPTSEYKVFFVNYYHAKSLGITWDGIAQGPGSNTLTVHWRELEWSTCTKDCAGGTQERKVFCERDDDHTRASEAICVSMVGPKPATKQDCNMQHCSPTWHISDWSPCSKSCATGKKVRTITCSQKTSNGTFLELDESQCQETKPTEATSEACNTVTCPAHWHVMTVFSTCSKSCGGGVATRDIGCRRTNEKGDDVIVSDLECSNFVKPTITESCNVDKPCPVWEVRYSACSVTCGEGVETPAAVCSVTNVKEPLPSTKCNADDKPDTSTTPVRSCNKGVCASHWWGTRKGKCTVTCGTGVHEWTLYCYNSTTNADVDSSKCDPSAKPTLPAPVACNQGVCIEEVIWKNDRFSSCSVTCGTGTRTNEPYCVRKKDNVEVNILSCDAAVQPAVVTESCSGPVCPLYSWVVNYGTCSVTCGEGTETGVAVCKNVASSAIVDNSHCSAANKVTELTRQCNLGNCPTLESYHWHLHKGDCTVTCGKGVISTELSCLRKDSAVKYVKVALKNCEELPKPEVKIESCELAECPPIYKWVVLNNRCKVGCGKGHDLLEVDCIDVATNKSADVALCGELTQRTPICSHEDCKAVYDDTSVPFYSLGCFFDSLEVRRVPHYSTSYRSLYSYQKPRQCITACFSDAIKHNYTYFALQFWGECWLGDESVYDTYDKNGVATRCLAGVGGGGINFVYHIGSPLAAVVLPPVVRKGCVVYKHENSTGSEAENLAHLIEWDEERLDMIIQNCAGAAHENQLNTFLGDHEAKCVTSEEELVTIWKKGTISRECFPEEGIIKQYYAFSFV